MRLIVASTVALAANAVALLIAAAVLGGFEVGNLAFPILVVIFTVVSILVSALVRSIVRSYAAPAAALTGLISAFLSLLVTDLVTDKLQIEGAGAWIVGTFLVWLASLVFTPMLRGRGDRKLGRDRG